MVAVTPTPTPTTPSATAPSSSGGIVESKYEGGFAPARVGYNKRFEEAWRQVEELWSRERPKFRRLGKSVEKAPVVHAPMSPEERQSLILAITAPAREAVLTALAAEADAARERGARRAAEVESSLRREAYRAAYEEMIEADDEIAIEAVMLLL